MRWATLLCLALIACAPRAQTVPAAQSHPDRWTPDALYLEGARLSSRGDLLKAEQYLALAVRAGYPADRALTALVRVCIRASRIRAALAHANAVLLRQPDSGAVRYLVATLHLALGQHARAREHLRELAREPSSEARAVALLRAVQDPVGRSTPTAETTRPTETATQERHAR